ncbi:hypothetical protein E1B28_007674 [Marasmius oreades]|uniref:Uncharacterized protein n=1 Tax=Marasmius oreades TaxID=181124 RepID=A0A9P7UUA0_9AGAR|nr:uncharacterized protein E1B28_007674 [Marasmius oreades]KAG7094055.1 hypothetical protein E1B28_007674 [Marasmius oreades]
MSDDDIQIIGTSAESFDLTQKGIKKTTTICIDDPPSSAGYHHNWDIGKKRSPRADLNKREPKRRRTGVNAHKASLSTSSHSRNAQDPKAPQEYITISSDEDEDLIQRVLLRADSTKSLKRSVSPVFAPPHGSPVSSFQKRWKADDGLELNSEEEEEEAFENMLADAKYRSDDEVPRIELPEDMSSLRLEDSTPPPRKQTIRMTSKQIRYQETEVSDSDELDSPLLTWTGLHAMHPLKKPRRRIRLSGIHNRLFVSEHNIMKTIFKQSSGPVGRIAQRRGNVAIASCVIGGSPDGPNEAPNHYNKSGCLVVWEESSSLPLVLHGHQSVLRRKVGEPWTKHYSVNDVQFEPHGTVLVSAGNDKKVHIWKNWDVRPEQRNYSEEELETLQEDLESDRADDIPFDSPPSRLLFKPDPRETILAIAEKNITLWHGLPADTSLTFRISRETGEKALSMLWGIGPTSDYLFASSESEQFDVWKGTHSCFDTNSTRPYFLDADKESGDALALQTDGKTLALFTSTKTTNTLRLYDVSTKQKKAFKQVALPEFRFLTPRGGEDEPEGAVNSAVFSSDGVFLAVARNDNRTHVYDTRMIERGIVYDFEHTGPSRVLPGEKSYGYGVTSMGWIQLPSSQRLGLVTGGNDGVAPTISLWVYHSMIMCFFRMCTIMESVTDTRISGERENLAGSRC